MIVGARFGLLEHVGDDVYRCACGWRGPREENATACPGCAALDPVRRKRCKERDELRRNLAMRSTAALRAAGHAAVGKAVRAGTIVRPECCSSCGEARPVVAHHEDYDKPLDIVWLCRSCHRRRHSELRREGVDLDWLHHLLHRYHRRWDGSSRRWVERGLPRWRRAA